MSKKLLEESTIRSFMKLANLEPLTNKFIKESWKQEEAKSHEEEEEEEEDEEEEGKMEEVRHVSDREDDERAADRLEEEVVEEEGEVTEEGKESEGRPSSPRPKVKGVAKPGKMAAAKHARKDDKMKPLAAGTHHSDRDDTIDTKGHSNAPKKNNSQFELVSESLEEEEMEAPEAGAEAGAEGGAEGSAEMGSAGESGEHQDKMKALIRDMLTKLGEMGSEYGLQMDVTDETGGGEGGGEEAPAPEAEAPAEEDEAMMQEKLDEMVEKLTKRVAARLVKESKKKR